MTIIDKLYHFALCLAVTTVFGWRIGTAVALTVEATQAEAFWRRGNSMKDYWWLDTFVDIIADAVGIVAGMYLRKLIGV